MGSQVRVQEQLFTSSNVSGAHVSAKHLSIVRHIVGYGAGIIMTILALRTLLMLLSAGTGNAFVDTVYSASYVFAWPFTHFFAPVHHGQWNLDIPSLVGIVTYAGLVTIVMTGTALLRRRLVE